MIRILVKEDKQFIRRVDFLGHADYAQYGEDIVCAAVSATYLCSVNACYLFHEETILVDSECDLQRIEVLDDNLDVQKILMNMMRCLKNLEEKYPKNIKIDKEEE